MHEKKNDDQEEREAEWKTDSTFTFYREIDLEKRFSMTGRSSSFNGDSWKDKKLTILCYPRILFSLPLMNADHNVEKSELLPK